MPQQLLLFPGTPAPTPAARTRRASKARAPLLVPVRVQRGDLWQLGSHRLLCGDATSSEDVARLMGGDRSRMVVTSPPYTDQRTYKLGTFDWDGLMCGAFAQMTAHLEADGQILINLGLSHKRGAVDMYWRHWLEHCASSGWPLFGWYVWDKGAALPGDWNGRYGPAFEFIFHFTHNARRPAKLTRTRGWSAHVETKSFRQRNNSLNRPNSPKAFGQSHKIPDSVLHIQREYARGIHTKHHPATYPVALPDFLMRSWSDVGDVVYEPFAGAGTTIIAAEAIGRYCYSMEIEPQYCDVILTRWEQATGQRATLLARDTMQEKTA